MRNVRDLIFNFWTSNIKSKLEDLKEYVIDFAIIENTRVYLIELNPYFPTTGPGLFCWNLDKELLHGINLELEQNPKDAIVFRSKKVIYQGVKMMFDDYFLEEMEKMSQEQPYWKLLEQIDPDYMKRDGCCNVF